MAEETTEPHGKAITKSSSSERPSLEDGHVLDADDGLLQSLGYKQVRA